MYKEPPPTIIGLTLTGPVTGTVFIMAARLLQIAKSGMAREPRLVAKLHFTQLQQERPGTALFSNLLNVQANAVIAATSGNQCPSTSINSASTTTVVIYCIITNSQNAVANGTVVSCTVTGY